MDAGGAQRAAGSPIRHGAAPPAMSVAVADAHALIWYAMGPGRKLGRRARALFERAERRQATIYVPVLVLVEIAEAIRRGSVSCEPGFSRWAQRLLASGEFVAADLTTAIVLESESLHAIPERGDRLIAATAVTLGCPLITSDPAIARVSRVATIW
jgi:PIN domain nuclease of toxin-antitoxin system